MKTRKSENRKQDELVDLIHTLSPSEKRYFKQFISVRDDSKGYEIIFDELAKAERYDASVLSRKLKKSIKTITDEKAYLQDVLLKALRNFHDRNRDIEYNNALNNIILLIEKEKYKTAASLIEKNLAKAEKNSRFDILYQLHRQKLSFLSKTRTNYSLDFLAEHNAILEKISNTLGLMQQQFHFDELSVKVSHYISLRAVDRTNQEKSITRKWLGHPLLTKKATHPIFKLYQLENKLMLYNILGDFKKAALCGSEIIALTEKYPVETQLDTENYFLNTHNYIHVLIANKPLDKAAEFIGKLQNTNFKLLPFNTVELEKLLMSYIPTYQALYYIRAFPGNISHNNELKDFLRYVKKNEQSIKEHLKPNSWYIFLYSIAKLHYKLNNLKESELWLGRIIQEGDAAVHPHLQSTVRVVYAIIHAELGNYSLLPSLIQSAKRMLQKHGLGTKVENTILSLLSKLPAFKNKAEKEAAFKTLQSQFQLFEKEPGIKMALKGFEYKLWVQRNIGHQ